MAKKLENQENEGPGNERSGNEGPGSGGPGRKRRKEERGAPRKFGEREAPHDPRTASEGANATTIQRRFARLSADLLSFTARVAADLELTPSDMVATQHLSLDGPLTPAELSRRVGLSSGATTTLIDRLEARGLARRAPHPSDRRRLLVAYVPQDRGIVGPFYDVLNALSAATGPLTERERHAVAEFLAAASRALSEPEERA